MLDMLERMYTRRSEVAPTTVRLGLPPFVFPLSFFAFQVLSVRAATPAIASVTVSPSQPGLRCRVAVLDQPRELMYVLADERTLLLVV
jgi:hypothetical protein